MKLSPNFVFNADDAGLSLTMSKDLLDQVQEGSLNGISVLMNGESVKWLKEALQASQTEQIQIKLHLNLSDGKSLTSPEKIPMLVNANGHFRYTFVSLFFRYCFSSTRARRLLSEQIEMEIKSQLKAFSDTFSGKIRVDGHNHIHMLPFVFSTLLKTNNLFPLYFVRIPQEKFLFSYFRPFRIRIANLLKFVLLNSLSRLFNYRARLSRGGIRSNRFFFGVLFSGDVRLRELRAFCDHVEKNRHDEDVAEVCIHPGLAEPYEIASWSERDQTFFISEKRVKEKKVLKEILGKI